MGRKLLGDVDEVDTNAGCGESAVMGVRLALKLTLQESRCALGHVFDQDLAPTIQQETVQRRLFFVLGHGSARLAGSASSPCQDLDSIP
jgi:hypothetical protein